MNLQARADEFVAAIHANPGITGDALSLMFGVMPDSLRYALASKIGREVTRTRAAKGQPVRWYPLGEDDMARMSYAQTRASAISRIKRGDLNETEQRILGEVSSSSNGVPLPTLRERLTYNRSYLEKVLTHLRGAGLIENAANGGPMSRWCLPECREAALKTARAERWGAECNDPGWLQRRERERRAARAAIERKERKASPPRDETKWVRHVVIVSAADVPAPVGVGPASVFHLAAFA